MKQRIALFAITLLISAAMSIARADDLICSNTPDTPFTGSAGDVTVPAGASCWMHGATVDNITVYGTLEAYFGTVVRGNIEGEPGHGDVRLAFGTIVHGDVEATGGTGPLGSGFYQVMVGGNVEFKNNATTPGLLFISGTVGGNLEVYGNTGPVLNLGDNTIGGNLECKGNSATPGNLFFFPPSTVGGNREGQCADPTL